MLFFCSEVELRGLASEVAEVLGSYRTISFEADLRYCILTGATFDGKTAWPEGFDPVAAGVFIHQP